jgi:hypothetical protein
MLNDKPDNRDWKNKLEELESSAGEGFNKEASWDKLHIRLQTKQKKRKATWHWIAAACLLFALFIPLFLSNKKENVLVKNNVLQKKIDSSSSQYVPLINNGTPALTTSSTMENKIPVHFSTNNDKTIGSINDKIIKPEIIRDKGDKEIIITQAIHNNAVTHVDTAISIVANLPEKKKLKVVHINELGEPVTDAPNIARLYNRHSFQFKFMNQEGYTTSSNFSINNNKVLKNLTTINLPSN